MPEPPKELVFQENKSFIFAHAAACPGCSRVLDESGLDADFVLVDRTFDVSVTHDGAVVVSDAFVSACADAPGVRFEPIATEARHAVLRVDPIVRIEPFGSGVKAGPVCSECGVSRYRIRRGPIHLDADEMVGPGFFRTDLLFGDTADFGPDRPVSMRPHYLVDSATGKALKDASLIGVHLITQPWGPGHDEQPPGS
ncbi:MAG: hypothetical protein WKF60_05935 [Ilumatobacter sp.]